MAELVGQAAEDDEQFWNDDVWKEDEDDSEADSFEEEEEVKPDEFDSDFNDTETEDESGSDDEVKVNKSATGAAMVSSGLAFCMVTSHLMMLLTWFLARKQSQDKCIQGSYFWFEKVCWWICGS